MSGAASAARDVRCPKCDAGISPGDDACRACGLAAERFESYQRDPVAAPPEVVAAWQACAVAWDDDAAHERFCAVAAAGGGLAFAAGAYRRAARERPGDERAAAGLARIQRMAEVSFLSRAPGERAARRPWRGATILLIVLLLLASLGVTAALMARATRGEAPEPPSSSAGRRGKVESL